MQYALSLILSFSAKQVPQISWLKNRLIFTEGQAWSSKLSSKHDATLWICSGSITLDANALPSRQEIKMLNATDA